jgi:two-component system NtrC family sensor kinase
VDIKRFWRREAHAALLRRLPRWMASVLGAGLAMTSLGLATLLWGPLPPFLFAYPAVAIVTLLAGPAAGVGTAVACLAWLLVPWLPPVGDPMHAGSPTPASAGLFFVLSCLIATVAWRLRPASAAALDAGESPDPVSARGIRTLMVLSVVLPLAAFAVVAHFSHDRAFANAQLRADRATRIAQEHAAKVLDTNEAIIGRILDLAGDASDAALRRREPELHARLKAIADRLPQIQSIWLFDAAGLPLVTDRYLPAPVGNLDVTDREYFRWHRDHRDGLFISEPAIGKVTGQAFFDTSRRREGNDGRFEGVASVSLSPQYFVRFYEELAQAEPGLTMALVRRDGVVLARYPESSVATYRAARNPAFMDRMAAGESRGTLPALRSTIDGSMRLLTFRSVDRYPLYATAAIAHSVIVAGWQRDMALLAGVLFPMSAVLTMVAWIALRRAQREQAALWTLQLEVESRKKAEQALLQTQKLEALGLLTGSVAHDFNNLLAVVNNNAHLIERVSTDPNAKPLASAIRRAVNTGTQLTRQLLAFSRRQPLRPVVVDLHDAIPRTMDLVRTTVGRHIDVTLHLAAGLRAVTVDEAELELALINLALNARDAMPEGGRLAVFARNVRHDDDATVPEGETWVAISVADTGTGMADDVRDHAFEPFYTTKAPGLGTGLGLSQVLGMCTQARGSARITSERGVGTTVVICLPAAPAAPAAAPEPERDRTLALPFDVLLVEDNRELALTIRALLESFGARVTHADSAASALAAMAARQAPFDVVLSDIMMPGTMNGLALARTLRERRPTQPVVLMTGYTAEIHSALASGFDVLPKPCVPEQLVEAIAAAHARCEPVAG